MDQLISVIIPVYNRTNYLPECMDSLRKQSYQNLQIILVDDGSTDGSVELCQRYAQEDSRVRFIAAAHGGVSAARNLALEAAEGEFVLFVDSDDVVHPLLAESLLKSLVDTGAGIAGTRTLSVSSAKWSDVPSLIQSSPVPAETYFRRNEKLLDDFFNGRSPFGVIGGILIRRDLIGDTRFNTDLYVGEDYYFIYQNLIKGTDAVYLRQQWYYYRNHGQNSSGFTTYEAFWTRFYRRKLVWQSEEALGRTAYANIQKRNAVSIFLRAITLNTLSKADMKKVRSVIKAHRKDLFPALRIQGKIRYFLAMYLPFTQRIMRKIKKLFKK